MNLLTEDILVDSFKKGVISKEEAETIWSKMLEKRRKIGASSFEEYLRNTISNSY